MRRLYLILLIAINLNASEYLPFILKAIKANLKLPVKLQYGKITKISIEDNKTLVLYIRTDKKVTFQKKKVCKLPLFQDIIKEDGTIKYVLSGKSKGEYTFNQDICNNQTNNADINSLQAIKPIK